MPQMHFHGSPQMHYHGLGQTFYHGLAMLPHAALGGLVLALIALALSLAARRARR